MGPQKTALVCDTVGTLVYPVWGVKKCFTNGKCMVIPQIGCPRCKKWIVMAARCHNFKIFFCSKLKKQNSIMVLDIFEDNTGCMNDSVQGGHPVTHGSVQVSVHLW